MLKRNLLFVLLLIFASNILLAQSENEIIYPEFNFKTFKKSSNESAYTGNLSIDNKISFDAVQKEISKKILNPESKSKKSPWLGALFSLLVPGAGEFYAESYWKTGIFVAIEAAVVTTAIIYNKKGNDQTDFFQNYANKNWSAVRYAHWLVYYGAQQGITITINDSKVRNGDYSEIHAAENQFSNLSHNLAPYGEQQYYEMIGKYDQFAGGWDDFDSLQTTTTPISPNFKYYSGLRGKANDYYSVASTAVIGIYLNHFLSAIDAYWSTTIYNKDLLVKMTVENQRYADRIELVPTIKLKLSF